jgi:hypothetical protein
VARAEAAEPAAGEAAAAPAAAPAAATAPANELNGLAFAWSVLVGFVKSLFQKKPASHHG